MRLIDYLTESIPFVDEYILKKDDTSKKRKKYIKPIKRVIDAMKWREYLQSNNGKN